MTVKKKYNIGDTVWIYGVTNGKTTEGTIVQTFTIKQEGWDTTKVYYVIAIPTEIEPLLEVRTWETISQTKDGHVGTLREVFADPAASIKVLRRTGINLVSNEDSTETTDLYIDEGDDPTPEQIHAAIERAEKARDPIFNPNAKPAANRPAKKRTFAKRNKPDASSSNNS